jgi:hypothetical protein
MSFLTGILQILLCLLLLSLSFADFIMCSPPPNLQSQRTQGTKNGTPKGEPKLGLKALYKLRFIWVLLFNRISTDT